MSLKDKQKSFNLRLALAFFLAPFIGVFVFHFCFALYYSAYWFGGSLWLNQDFFYQLFLISIFGLTICYPFFFVIGIPSIFLCKALKLSVAQSFFFYFFVGYLGSWLGLCLIENRLISLDNEKLLLACLVSFISWLFMYAKRDMQH